MSKLSEVVLVVGATGGMGSSICKRLIKDGYRIGFIGRSEKKVKSLEAELSLTGEAKGFIADIAEDTDIVKVMSEIKNYFGHIDHLVQAAGNGQMESFLTADSKSWFNTWNVKFMGTVRVLKAVAQQAIDEGRKGSFVLINGIFSREPSQLFPINSSVNCAISGLAKSVSGEFAQNGIRINIINPGATNTPLWKEICDDLAVVNNSSAMDINQHAIDSIPLKRLAEPNDIANAVSFLLSAESMHITGTELTIDGGACHSI